MSNSTATIVFLLVSVAGGIYAYKALTGPHIDPSMIEQMKPYNPRMRVNLIAFHNDPTVNKAWWDNQHKRKDRIYQSPPEN